MAASYNCTSTTDMNETQLRKALEETMDLVVRISNVVTEVIEEETSDRKGILQIKKMLEKEEYL